jgi:S1-C subfamily serine protease
VGALVGALVAGGIVVAFDDDRTTVVRARGDATSRPAAVLETPGDIREVLDAVQPAVVRIDVQSGFRAGAGSGFVISPDGVIVTNAHVVDGADEVVVTLDDGDQEDATVLGADTSFDLAVLKIERTDLPVASLGSSDELQVGDAVIAIGSALGLEGGSGPSVTSGIVSALDRSIGTEIDTVLQNVIQTDAAINPGNSGGPLLDTRGRVVGINTAIANPGSSNNVGFAISIDSARPVIDALREGRTPEIAFLGVSAETVTPQLAEQRDLGVDVGAYVRSVEANSPAEAAGIETGDVIVEVDGTAVTRAEEVVGAIRRHAPGDEVSVTVDRDGRTRTFDIVLGERPAQAS